MKKLLDSPATYAWLSLVNALMLGAFMLVDDGIGKWLSSLALSASVYAWRTMHENK